MTDEKFNARTLELRELFKWIIENPNEWYRMCNCECERATAGYILELTERLCTKGFLCWFI